MTHRFEGLHLSLESAAEDLPECWYLVRVVKAQYYWHRHRPFYVLQLAVQEPGKFNGRKIFGRLDCTAKTLWKLGWFLRDFGYDGERLSRDEVDERSIAGLCGVVRISPLAGKEVGLVHFDGFAAKEEWRKLAGQGAGNKASGAKVMQ